MKKTNLETTKRLWRKAQLASWILACVPFVRMIGLNGSVASQSADADSDIDFLIITKPGRIWSCRALTVLAMAFWGLKRYPDKVAGRVCLNLYQTEDHLELTTKNKKLALSHAATFPFWTNPNIFKNFILANLWLKDFGCDFQYRDYQPGYSQKMIGGLAAIIRAIGEFIYDLFFNDAGENWLRIYQTKRINHDPRTISAPPQSIYLSDFELRFHPPKNH